MADSVYVDVDADTGFNVVLTTVRCEMVGAREAPIIEAAVREKGKVRGWKVLMDLSAVTVLASMGLGMLVNLNKQCNAEGGKLVVCGVAPDIMGVLKITRLDGMIKIVPNVEKAKELLRAV